MEKKLILQVEKVIKRLEMESEMCEEAIVERKVFLNGSRVRVIKD